MQPYLIMSWTESDAAHKLIRSKNRKASRIARKSSIKSKAQKDAEGMEMTDEEVKEIITLIIEEYNPPQSHSVYRKYPMEKVAMAMKLTNTRPSLKKWSFGIGKMNAEGMEMTPDIMDYPGLPVVPDSYGTNSALESGQGVPQWYGSAESFEAMAFHNPSGDDRDDVKAQFKMTYPGFTMSNSSLQYLIYQSGSSNKYHMFWLAQDKSGGWYAFSGYGRIGYAARMVRITGPTSQETAMRAMQSKINNKVGKGYTNVSRDFGMSAEESGKFMTFGEISYQYEYEDPSDGPLDSYDVQSIQRAVEGYIDDSGKSQGEGVFAHYASDNDIVISVSWTHKYSGINSAEEVQAGLPVIPDSYGTNSALSSGQGVPQWYGSAEQLEDITNYSHPMGRFASEYQDMMCCGEHMEYHESNKVNYFYCPICEESIKTNEFDAEASDEDWDRTEYEYKEVELAKPFRTAFMASLGFVVAPLVLIAGLAFALGDE
jgi:predicted DNA-binding WGR domain protein